MTDRPSPYDCFTVADLLVDYADQILPSDQTERVSAHLSQCAACRQEVAQLREIAAHMTAIEPAMPAPGLRNHFLELLEQEKAAQAAPVAPTPAPQEARLRPMWTGEATRWALRIAAGVALLVTGIALGLWWRPTEAPAVAADSPAAAPQYAVRLASALSGEAAERLSASERIQLVSNAATEADATGDPVVQVLINTLNFDTNANVRLAAASALYRLRADPRVGEAFTQSLSIQTDPNVQIVLIEFLVNMRERRAATQLEQLAQKTDALPVVRQQAEYGLGTLL
jgi:anti-sigma factor RsiW